MNVNNYGCYDDCLVCKSLSILSTDKIHLVIGMFCDVCVIELVIKQLKLSNDSSPSDNVDEVREIFRELEEHLPKVKDMALSAKRSAAVAATAGDSTADCTSNVVVCSSRF